MRKYNHWLDFSFNFTIQDIVIGFVILFFILIAGFFISVRKTETNPLYRYYLKGLVVKMLGSLIFALVYGLYYGGGDTVAYWYGGEALKNVFYNDPSIYFSEIFEPTNNEKFFNHYNPDTGWPPSWLYKSPKHFFVCKVVSIFSIFVPSSFLGVTFIMGFIAYHGTWKLFETVTFHYPDLTKYLQMGILFLPSTLFWCSGIMKDTIVLTGVCWIVHETDLILRSGIRKKRLRFVLRLIIWGWLIFSCKPYVIIALVLPWIIWVNYSSLNKIKSGILKYYLLPILFIGFSVIGFRVYSLTSAQSEFSTENLMGKAMVSRNDFSTNKTYGNNRFKAKTVTNSTSGAISAIPEALISGLFRPFIWEVRSPFILISGIENLFILLYLIYAIYKLKLGGFMRFIRSDPFLLFSILFTLLLAYMVGFTSMVFGALVRFRTPMLPFFVCFIIVAAGKIRKMRGIITRYSSSSL